MSARGSARPLTMALKTGLGLLALALTDMAVGATAPPPGDSPPPAVSSHPPMRPLPTPGRRPLAPGRALFVDAARGSDQGTGSPDRPWRSLRHALERLEPGVTLYLREGIYHERIRTGLRGERGRPITLRSYPGELAVLDGGFKEFLLEPESAWEPFDGGAPGEYRSRRSYPGVDRPQGHFGDSMVPLHGYRKAADLRSDNEHWVDHEIARYCGPGLWLDPDTDRIHIRLAPTRLEALAPEDRYRGESDPRRLPLVITGGDRVTLHLDGAAHLVLQDLTIRGAGSAALLLADSSDITVQGLVVYSGLHALELEGSEGLRVLDSVFRGNAAPWSYRSSLKYRGVASILVLSRGLLSKSRRLELAYNEFTDGHDGVFLGETSEVDFHHNLVDNFNDDGLFLTSRVLGGRDIRIYLNRFSRCLTTFAFGWGRGLPNLPGSGVHICRNIVDLRQPVPYFPPPPEGSAGEANYGRVSGDHGSPVWEPLWIYHNTFVSRRLARSVYALGWGAHLERTSRRLFNNIFVLVEQAPGASLPSPDSDFQADGNLYWGPQVSQQPRSDPLASFRASPAFEASRERYPPGWEAGSLAADPRFVSLGDDGGEPDLRLRPDSPAVDAGVELPAELPDPLRGADAGPPDIGALPLRSAPLRVGPRP